LIECLWAREAEGRRKMVRTKDWKYVFDYMGDKDELYDLKNDPWEHYNLASKKEFLKKKNELKSLLLDWMIETEDPYPVPLPESVGPEWANQL
jgi:Arylsulfatase A and related enzymes